MRRAVPAAIGIAAVLTLAANITMLLTNDALRAPSEPRVSREVAAGSPEDQAVTAPVTVAKLKKLYTPHFLVASPQPLPADAVARVKAVKGVRVVEVVDGASTQVAGRPVGLLGVDPSTFRNLAPKEAAKSDALWKNVASGDLIVSFEGAKLGTIVPAGSPAKNGSARIGAYAALGVPGVEAIVSREQAHRLGLANGNAMLVSAPKQNLPKLRKRLLKLLPAKTKISVLSQRTSAPVRVASTARSPLTGTVGCSPHMQAVRNEIDALFGPFPVIGCARPGDPQDHGTGNASDFMVSTGGQMPTKAGFAQGDKVAGYVISNAARLRLKYVIWRQHIWNPSICRCWRLMGDRGSITQNHYDHPHVSVY